MILSYDDYIKQCDETFAISTFNKNNYPKEDEKNCRYSLTPIGYDLKIGYAIIKKWDNKDKEYKYKATEKILNDLKNNPKAKLDDNDNKNEQIPFSIAPKTGAIIVTLDSVYLSDRIAGTIHARGTLSSKGLMINPITIDPNYRGRLIFYVYNSSHLPITLYEKGVIVTLILHQIKTATIHNAVNYDAEHVLNKYEKYENSNIVHKLLNEYFTTFQKTNSDDDFNNKCFKIKQRLAEKDGEEKLKKQKWGVIKKILSNWIKYEAKKDKN